MQIFFINIMELYYKRVSKYVQTVNVYIPMERKEYRLMLLKKRVDSSSMCKITERMINLSQIER